MLINIFIYIAVSIAIVIGIHQVYEYIKLTYITRRSKDVSGLYAKKYQQIFDMKDQEYTTHNSSNIEDNLADFAVEISKI
jgi:hypothetical protein